MTDRNIPVDRSKLDQGRRHILTGKQGISNSATISLAVSSHHILLLEDIIDNCVIKKNFCIKQAKKWDKTET
jgi:hypothetical protein